MDGPKSDHITLHYPATSVFSHLSHYGGKLMTKQEKEKGILLSGEDRTRTVRLQEEVAGRLEELYLITARTLGQTVHNVSRLVFTWTPGVPAEGSSTDQAGLRQQAPEQTSYIKITLLDDNGNCQGVYED